MQQQPSLSSAIQQNNFITGGGEVAKLMLQKDWRQTGFGNMDDWPQSLRTLVSLMLNHPSPMYIAWGSNYTQLYNDAFIPVLGIQKHPYALGSSGKETFGGIWNTIEPVFEKVMLGEAVVKKDYCIKRPEYGNLGRFFDFTCTPIIAENGTVAGIFATVTETTDTKKALADLAESENKFVTMAESTDIMISVAGPDLNTIYYNPAWSEFTGKSLETMLHFGWRDLIHPDDLVAFENKFRLSLEQKQKLVAELRVLDKSGNYRWLLAQVPAHFNSDGSIAGFVSSCIDITSLKEAEKSLQENEKLFETISEASEVLVTMTDATGNAFYFNNRWQVFTGNSPERLLQTGWLKLVRQLVHEEDREALTSKYFAALGLKENWMHEYRLLNKSDQYRWVLTNGVARFAADESFAGYTITGFDITSRKLAEQVLLESETQIRSLIESAPFPIAVYIGREMHIHFVNQSVLDVWGKGNDVVGKTYREVLPELESQGVYQQLDDVFTTGIPFHARNQLIKLKVNGILGDYYFNYSFTPLFDANGKVYGLMNTAADVTDLAVAKARLEHSERNIRNMIIQAPVAMCLLMGPEHVVDVANTFMIDLWGKRSEDVMNKPVFEALPDAKDQGLEVLLKQVYTRGEKYAANERPVVLVRHGKAEIVYQNFVYDPYRDADGNILGVLAISLDVSAQVQARQKIEETVGERTRELAEANASLLKSNEELAQFAYIASHDLQEPLRKIGTFSQMLEHSLADANPQAKKYLEKIKNSSDRMTLLIRDVLAYSQLSKKTEHYLRVDLNDIITDVKSDYDLLIEQKNAFVNIGIMPSVEAIPLQMSQLFGNLLSNALKYNRQGVQPAVNITATVMPGSQTNVPDAKQNATYCVLKIADNGIGIQPEFLDRIFNIFQRLHGKYEYAGTGIGLAICKKIVQNHKGFIYAESNGTDYTVFTVIIPQTQS